MKIYEMCPRLELWKNIDRSEVWKPTHGKLSFNISSNWAQQNYWSFWKPGHGKSRLLTIVVCMHMWNHCNLWFTNFDMKFLKFVKFIATETKRCQFSKLLKMGGHSDLVMMALSVRIHPTFAYIYSVEWSKHHVSITKLVCSWFLGSALFHTYHLVSNLQNQGLP